MDSSKNSSAVIILINPQHLRIIVAMVTSRRYTNMTRRGTSRCKKTTAFDGLFLQHGLLVTRCSDEALIHVWKSVEAMTTARVQVLSALENGKLSSWGSSHLGDISCLTRLWKPLPNCRSSIWAILAWFLRNLIKSVSRGELAKRIFSHYLPVLRPRSAWYNEMEAQSCWPAALLAHPPFSSACFSQASVQNLCKTLDTDVITKRNTFGFVLSCFLYHHF